MKKNHLLLAFAIVFVNVLHAQTVIDAVKLLNYGKLKSAKTALQSLVAANPKDNQAAYWLGQTLLVADDVKAAKAFYQQALNSNLSNDAFMIVGMGHVELLESGDINSAKQKFEQAITACVDTKGKNKGKPTAAILVAIGRANCIGRLVKDGSSKFGDALYAIDKLNQAATADITAPDMYINMGICYRKMGGEFGGDAQQSYTKALERDPKNAQANYLIGKIYSSQNNRPLMDQYFGAAIAADVAFAPVYLDNYLYYANKDVAIAKDNIEKYIMYGDKDCNNDFLYADYLFRASKFSESIAKAKELEGTECKTRVSILYAYNYDRLNDSLQAKTSVDNFLATATPDKIQLTDYDIAIKIYSRFAGTETKVIELLNKQFAADSSKNNKINYLTQIADLHLKQKNYTDQIKTFNRIAELKGTFSESDYYRICNAYLQAKDFGNGLETSKKYLAAFPDKPQPASFFRKSAIGLDPDSTKGTAIEPLTFLNSVLEKDTAKNKKAIFNNLYYMYLHFADKTKNYAKAIDVLDKMLVLYNNPGEENKFIIDQKASMQQMLKSPAKTAATKPTSTATKPAAAPVKKK
jgi:Tfp pilus assembly protein PilF